MCLQAWRFRPAVGRYWSATVIPTPSHPMIVEAELQPLTEIARSSASPVIEGPLLGRRRHSPAAARPGTIEAIPCAPKDDGTAPVVLMPSRHRPTSTRKPWISRCRSHRPHASTCGSCPSAGNTLIPVTLPWSSANISPNMMHLRCQSEVAPNGSVQNRSQPRAGAVLHPQARLPGRGKTRFRIYPHELDFAFHSWFGTYRRSGMQRRRAVVEGAGQPLASGLDPSGRRH